MTDDQIIAVIQARKEGKNIQCRALNDDARWGHWISEVWKFDQFDYRVAPEPRKPREFWLRGLDNSDRVSVFQINGPLELSPADAIRVREVIDES